MSTLVSLSISIGVLAGVITWIFLSAWSGPLVVWAAFVAWACFYHTGGDNAALKNTIVGNTFGVVCAWAALLVIVAVPLGETLTLPLWAGIVVGISVIILVLGAHIPAFAVIPASVYGYACTAAFALGGGASAQMEGVNAFSVDAFLSVSFANALINFPVSMAGGIRTLADEKFEFVLQPRPHCPQ